VLGENGGETIRIGTSTWSMFDSRTTVEKNIFDHCDGEIEIISNKSCKNILRENLFFECNGTLTLRHGNDADVYGNYFIGNGLDNTGGIRVIAENHKVHDNYFQGLTGTGLMAAISIMDGLPNPELTSHWQVKNATIYNNIIINCEESLNVGAGKNVERYLKPQNTSFSNNIISTKERAIHWSDDSAAIKFENNLIWLAPDANEQLAGFIKKDPQLQKDDNNFYHEKNKSLQLFWQTEMIGPEWLKLKKQFTAIR
jgi:poly(beta-D-mannuronate) lyase